MRVGISRESGNWVGLSRACRICGQSARWRCRAGIQGGRVGQLSRGTVLVGDRSGDQLCQQVKERRPGRLRTTKFHGIRGLLGGRFGRTGRLPVFGGTVGGWLARVHLPLTATPMGLIGETTNKTRPLGAIRTSQARTLFDGVNPRQLEQELYWAQLQILRQLKAPAP